MEERKVSDWTNEELVKHVDSKLPGCPNHDGGCPSCKENKEVVQTLKERLGCIEERPSPIEYHLPEERIETGIQQGGTLYLITLRGPCKEDYQVARLIRARHDFNFNAAIEEFCSSTGTECANGFFSTYDDCEKFLLWLEENGIRPVAYEELELHYRSFDD